MCAIPKSAMVFHFVAVELWNYNSTTPGHLKMPWLRGELFGHREASETALRLSNSVWPRIATVHMAEGRIVRIP